MIEVHVDLETRARRDLRKCGVRKYVGCPDFRVLCVAFAVNDNPVVSTLGQDFFTYPEFGDTWHDLKELAEREDTVFVAHNAAFEQTVWNHHIVQEYGMPVLPPNRWRCTAAAAAYRNLPRSLDLVGKALELTTQKDTDGHDLMMKMCKPIPESYTKMREENGDWYEHPKQLQRLMEYCEVDVETERCVHQRIGLLPEYLQKQWVQDQEINQRGIRVDLELADAILEMKTDLCADLKAECQKIYGMSPSQVQKIKDYMTEHGVPVPLKMDMKTREKKETLESAALKRLLLDPDVPDNVKHLLRLRQDYATTSLAKVDAVLNYEVDGYIYDQFLFHGASTGRWAGKGIQLHNLPRGILDETIAEADMNCVCNLIKDRDFDGIAELYPDHRTMEVLKTAIRGLIVPRPGKKLVVMDFSQIESRVLGWLAGHEEKLDIFRSGKDVYKYNACAVYGKEYDDITKAERSGGGKVSELACGYQGGENAILSMAVNIGLHLTKDQAIKIKEGWRAGNKSIVNFWYSLQDAAIRAVTTGKAYRVGYVTFKVVDGWLACKLPSGRKLWYYAPEVKTVNTQYGKKKQLTYMGVDMSKGKPWNRMSTYGGKLCENLTQGVARDMLAEAMEEGKYLGWPQILHVHDEAGFEVDEDDTTSLGRVQEFMCQPPEWAKDCPVDAAGYQSQRYRKD